MKKQSNKSSVLFPAWIFVLLASAIYVAACVLIGKFKPTIFHEHRILIEFIGIVLLALCPGLPLIDCALWIKTAVTANKKKSKQKNSNRSRKVSGFAETKQFPHKKHPANFRGIKGCDEIEYLTFTHSDEVTFDNGEKVKTKPLTSNINPSERGTLNENGEPNISYVYPTVYIGKRSELGKGTKAFSLTNEDSAIVDELFKTLPRKEVRRTSNSKKKKPRD